MDRPYEFRPTHVAPEDGLQTWASPDPSRPSARIDPLLPVQLAGTSGNWARIVCSNGWSAWVDGRLLVSLPHRPPGTAQPLATTDDPRPLLAALERALASYRELVDELADGRLDLETFRRRSSGMRLGAVVDGPAAWLLDLEQGRWYYCDGTQLQTYATVERGDT
ncbi:hypothetical protein GCM10010193_15200 [Kitasatospora atroaurantiaca]|uniref:Uncharacterized protein n=1 Tax=Kitasatospora atroaurantiaca TaxID=285545 RepID=A0A561EIG1_9ACTN|nr:hypothetical protein [Kitasatospora atroaurantiaca]TWE15407.1 hypothetical protein FB465_0300 [Kitasatospora atroaurantiaca]